MPDLESFVNVERGESGKQLFINFEQEGTHLLAIEFKKLSDGEKCFFLSAIIVAANQVTGPVLCLGEPDNHSARPRNQPLCYSATKNDQPGRTVYRNVSQCRNHPQFFR